MQYIDEEDKTDKQDNFFETSRKFLKMKFNTSIALITSNLLIIKEYLLNIFFEIFIEIQGIMIDYIIPFLFTILTTITENNFIFLNF